MDINWLAVLAPLASGAILVYVQRVLARADKQIEAADARHRELDRRVDAMELRLAAEMPTKEDIRDQNRKIEHVSAMLHEVRDMVIRMDAREAKSQ